ncbi:MAG: hypothetical protein IPP20_20620 [Gemmatimonadetes bacterium]|nr:hypothetical protein [Gemmatimonadota bacterium]
MRETWSGWRRALWAVGALLVVGGVGTLYVLRDARRLVVMPNLLMLVPRDSAAPFLRDSAYLVRLGGPDEGAYPMRIAAWHVGGQALMSERQIRNAVEGAVAARVGAKYELVPGGVMTAGGAPGVTIALEFWAHGGFATTVGMHCARSDRVTGRTLRVQFPVTENRGVATEGEGLTRTVAKLLEEGSKVRCPAWPGGTALAKGEVAAATVVAPVTAVGSEGAVGQEAPPASAEAPDNREVSVSPVSPAERARRDSVTLRKVGETNASIVRLTIAVDTLHVRVGEEVKPEPALRLAGVMADGTLAPRVIPLYVVDDMRIAAFGIGGLRGLRPGVTRVVVRAMGGNLATVRSDGASVSFIVKVEP